MNKEGFKETDATLRVKPKHKRVRRDKILPGGEQSH